MDTSKKRLGCRVAPSPSPSPAAAAPWHPSRARLWQCTLPDQIAAAAAATAADEGFLNEAEFPRCDQLVTERERERREWGMGRGRLTHRPDRIGGEALGSLTNSSASLLPLLLLSVLTHFKSSPPLFRFVPIQGGGGGMGQQRR